jgi:ABC-type nickel/cobalt efflux system permease component RcnA
MSVMLPYTTALLLGSLHALEADHMAAVTSFAVRRPGLREAARFGVRWATGHGGAIILVGAALLLLGTQLPAAAGYLLERFVGVVMIGLGLWTLFGAARAYRHAGTQAPDATRADAAVTTSHTHADGGPHVHARGGHRHAVTAVGVVHGLAGSGATVALIPVVMLDSPVAGIGYLLIFALGTIIAMAAYAVLAGFLVGRAAARSLAIGRGIARATGLVTIAIGAVWLLR